MPSLRIIKAIIFLKSRGYFVTRVYQKFQKLKAKALARRKAGTALKVRKLRVIDVDAPKGLLGKIKRKITGPLGSTLQQKINNILVRPFESSGKEADKIVGIQREIRRKQRLKGGFVDKQTSAIPSVKKKIARSRVKNIAKIRKSKVVLEDLANFRSKPTGLIGRGVAKVKGVAKGLGIGQPTIKQIQKSIAAKKAANLKAIPSQPEVFKARLKKKLIRERAKNIGAIRKAKIAPKGTRFIPGTNRTLLQRTAEPRAGLIGIKDRIDSIRRGRLDSVFETQKLPDGTFKTKARHKKIVPKKVLRQIPKTRSLIPGGMDINTRRTKGGTLVRKIGKEPFKTVQISGGRLERFLRIKETRLRAFLIRKGYLVTKK